MIEKLKPYWQKMEPRDRVVLTWGSLVVALILFYSLVWQPWQAAIDHLESALPKKRTDLVWMQQQAALLKNGGVVPKENTQGVDKSLLSIVEKTAKSHNLRGAIQKMSPGETAQEVRVVLSEADFNHWISWVDVLFKEYAVRVKQVSVQKEDGLPNKAEIRVTFIRNV